MAKAGFYGLRCRGYLLSKNLATMNTASIVLRDLAYHEEYLVYTKREALKLRTRWRKSLPKDFPVDLVHVLLEAHIVLDA